MLSMDKLIIDTDIGSDIDDALALTLVIRAGINVPLITTVHGDTKKRARIAKKLTDLLDVNIPIVAGEQSPIKQRHIFWYGYEGHGLISDDDKIDTSSIKDNAPEAIAETIYQNPGNISIAGIGPLTNIAKAFQRYPDLPGKINKIYLMGGIASRPTEFVQTYRAHNFKVDPEACDIVFDADVDKILITTEISKKTSLTFDDLTYFEKRKDDKILPLLACGARYWMNHINYDCAYLYDPLTVAHHINPDLTSKLINGRTSVALDLKEDFKKMFLDIITRNN